MWRRIVQAFAAISFLAGVVGWITLPDDAALWPTRLRPLVDAIGREDIITALFALSAIGFAWTIFAPNAGDVRMTCPHHVRRFVIEPVLREMAEATAKPALASPKAVALMLATWAVESGCGKYLAQGVKTLEDGAGPGQGWWSVECWDSYTAQDMLRHADQMGLGALWIGYTGYLPSPLCEPSICHDLADLLRRRPDAACMLGRLRYWTWPHAIPSFLEIIGAENLWLPEAAGYWMDAYWRGPAPGRSKAYERFMNAQTRTVRVEIARIWGEAKIPST